MIQVTAEDASSDSFENLPAYKAQKSLRAGKIISITPGFNVDVTVYVGNGRTQTYSMSGSWTARHHPKVGGYVVVVGDRYMSYMAAADFEREYKNSAQQAIPNKPPSNPK